jgi:hypothetical protein
MHLPNSVIPAQAGIQKEKQTMFRFPLRHCEECKAQRSNPEYLFNSFFVSLKPKGFSDHLS